MTEMTAPLFLLSPEQQAVLATQPVSGRPWVLLIEIEARVDALRLRTATERVLRAHQVLRHAFVRNGDQIALRQQRLDAMPPIEWQTLDLRNPASGVPDGAFTDWLAGFENAPLETGKGQLVRAAIVRTDEALYTLALAVNALAADRGSLRHLFSQIADAYAEGAEWAPAEPFQYAQFVEWREALAAGEEARTGQDYWERYLEGHSMLPALRLAYRKDGVAPQAGRRIACISPVGNVLAARVAATSQALGRAPEVLLQAAWWLLLARLHGFSRFIGGWQHDCRCDYEVMQGAVGVYDKVLPLVIDAQAEESFSSWLMRLGAVMEAHVDAQEYWAVEAPPLAAHLAVGFVGEDAPGTSALWRLRGLHDPTPGFELSMQVAWGRPNAGHQLAIHANAACYARPAVERLLQQFTVLLEGIVDAPSACLGELPLVGVQEREALLATSALQADFGPLTVAQHVARWAEATPDAPALVEGGHRLSYRQLVADANRMAHWLQAQGVAHGDLVALNLPRSAQLLVALLAVWQAGGAYLPLEPEWPDARRHAVVADAEPALVLYADSASVLPGTPCPGIALDSVDLSAFDASCPGTAASLGDRAYVLYTSGSTGKPKGAVIEHGALLNYVAAASSAMSLDRCRRWALTSSVAADLGNTALFGALFSGACLVIASAGDMSDAQAFSRFMEGQGIDGLKIVPSHLEALLECDSPCLPRTLVLGGEAAPPALVERILRLAPGCAIYNHYGPTEATVGVMVHAHDAGAAANGVMPLSCVLANNRVLVLDESLRLVPAGALGHVYIGGAQLCRGYLGRDSQEVFAPDPFHPGERLYRTGDLAYVLPQGGMQLAGRADHQVKVRGFRVEPAEIEAALLACAGVRQAVVVALETKGGDGKALVGFVLADAKEGEPSGHKALRDLLAARLPAHMVPARLVSLAAFPRLANGKIDRLALVTLARAEEERAQNGETSPRNALEATLAGCMAELLGRTSIGIDDDFFELGGHSLLAIKFAARMRRQLQVEVAPGLVFDYPTVAQLAAALGPLLLLQQQEVVS